MLRTKSLPSALFASALSVTAVPALADLETTPYGRIVGIETRQANMHVQTDFPAGTKLGCPVNVGSTYMYDLIVAEQGEGADTVTSVILAAFMAGKEVSFHLYQCNGSSTRPVIGHVRVR